MLPKTTATEASGRLERLRADLEVALADGRVPPFTMSAGVIDNSETSSATLDELVESADGLLLKAKSAGRNRVDRCDADEQRHRDGQQGPRLTGEARPTFSGGSTVPSIRRSHRGCPLPSWRTMSGVGATPDCGGYEA